jgi:deoxyribodipyrimidine photo-lyase
LPLFIHAPQEEQPWSPGAAADWWLHHALIDLNEQLQGRLLIRKGASLAALRQLLTDTGAAAVYWNRLYEPAAIARDTVIKRDLREAGVQAQSFPSAYLFEPWEISNRQGLPFRVFTPFWKHLHERGLPDRPVTVPDLSGRLPGETEFSSWSVQTVAALGLLPVIRWDGGLGDAWRVSRDAAEARLDEFVATDLARYDTARDLPASGGVSRLSPYLHFGQIGPREIVEACNRRREVAECYLREIGWREFANYQLYHFPHTSDEPMDPRFKDFPWRDDPTQLVAWQRGQTGIPLVDAGMRELWHTGWMHNRVRMIVASLLTKNLLLPWQQGARWFWDTLVDADLASNSMGWQWTAGSGADAAPYFRVFNPVLQGEKFDKAGRYVRRWVPELAALPDKWLHKPWEAPDAVLRSAGVVLGRDYPVPLVDLKGSRQRALDSWSRVK